MRWILGIIAWFFRLMMFWMADITHGTFSPLIILIITGILLAIYIYRKTRPKDKELEKENQELKTENQRLRQELEQARAVQRTMERAEKREKTD